MEEKQSLRIKFSKEVWAFMQDYKEEYRVSMQDFVEMAVEKSISEKIIEQNLNNK